jgi:aspartate racemase
MNPAIGILGGMGAQATCDLMSKTVACTDARNDREHIHIFVDCNTNIPDRTEAILHQGADPLPELVKSAIRLQTMGASVLIMPCNTAHYYIDAIKRFIDIPILNMLEETALHLRSQNIQTAAVLATDGTVQTGLYERALKAQDICPIYPDPAEQKAIMSLIYDCVKAGKPCAEPEKIRSLGQHLLDRGAEVLILGCTELPIAFAQLQLPFPTVDPTEILARAAVRFVGGKVKHPQAVR